MMKDPDKICSLRSSHVFAGMKKHILGVASALRGVFSSLARLSKIAPHRFLTGQADERLS